MFSIGTIVYLHIYHLNSIKQLQVCTNGFLLIIVHGTSCLNTLTGQVNVAKRSSTCKCTYDYHSIHYNLPNVTHVSTKVHVILRRYIVLAWMHDNRKLV